MPSKRSGKTQKLSRFITQDENTSGDFQLPPIQKYVANKSIREYGGLTTTKTALFASARGRISPAANSEKPKQNGTNNQFDALAELAQPPSMKGLRLGDDGRGVANGAQCFVVTAKPTSQGDTENDELSTPKTPSEPNAELTARDQEILEEAARLEQQQLDSCDIDDAWQCKSELPSSDEILPEDDVQVDIVPNLIDGAWESKEAYLKAHYDLCREDALSPLIDAVAELKANPKMDDNWKTCIYDRVFFTGVTYSQMGLAMRATFSSLKAQKNILWEYSSRLMSGDIVAISPVEDCFRTTCIIAVVAARPLEGVKKTPHEIDLYFADPAQAELDPQQEFIMVQGKTGYFEAYRHVLTSLQRMGKERFEFSKYICSLNTNIEVPMYIEENPFFDMCELYGPEDLEHKKVDVLNDWPSCPPSLDDTQWEALRSMLTRELAIIQGPPGTGKTHVSVVALKLLLSRQTDEGPPIIIAAQTNHALDQLLRHVAEFESNWIRLGSRSKDLNIKKRTLFNIRKKMVTPPMAEGLLGPAMKKRKQLQGEIKELLSPFSIDKSKSILPAGFFRKLGLLSDKQYDYLVRGMNDWVSSVNTDDDPLPTWLNDQKKKFEVKYKESSFGFPEDEVDLEYEQLKELEAEQGIDEEFDEELKGDYVPLMEGFQGYVSTKRKRSSPQEYLKRETNLWKTPDNQRGAIYNFLAQEAKKIVRDKFRRLYDEYQRICYRIKLGKFERDEPLLKSAKLIGMTTTGLNKYRALIQSLNPRTILIEEAAEVIEAPVVASCFDSLEHLILVGDHQQLQGHCTVQELEGEPYYLNVSMFERLVKNDMPFNTLLRQRRMAPPIRQVIQPIYPKLKDHEAVLKREPVPGMGDLRTYFFNHFWYESMDSLASRYNDGEARMVAMFYKYLRSNGIENQDITVLTFYNGQRKRILKYLREKNEIDDGQYLKVATVDSYQGEENEVIILSLVRSNDHSNIGFLEIANRVCVALSRARRGLYIFGNANCLVKRSSLWADIVTIMKERHKTFGGEMPLVCQAHQNVTIVKNPADLEKLGELVMTAFNALVVVAWIYPAATIVIENVDNRPAVQDTTSTENVEDEGPPRGRQLARNLEDAKNSWADFAKVTRADERSQAVAAIDVPRFDRESKSTTDGTPALSISTKHGVTITQLSKRQVSPQKKGVARFRYESSYTVTQSLKVEAQEKPVANMAEDNPLPKIENNGSANEPVTSDVLMGDLIDL
ncbi:Transcription factor spt8 [Ascosphaera pollenicola]|nr:Transcription factor spt8 [Ascosphaera pollenicola]